MFNCARFLHISQNVEWMENSLLSQKSTVVRSPLVLIIFNKNTSQNKGKR